MLTKIKFFKFSAFLLMTSTVSACSSFGYYMDLIEGHNVLIDQRQPVSALIENKSTKPKLRSLLKTSQKMRDFASKILYLPENDSYRHYADIKRPYAVWNVIAAKELSLEPKKWCFLFVGCLSYRGYFSKKDASEYAAELKKQGYDVHIAGAKAYSTLGWFDDPLLNTMMYQSEARRAGIIFHELAHQLIYIENNSAFNEAFATAVEQEGVRQWLNANGKEQEYETYLAQKKRDSQINDLLLTTKNELSRVYKTKITEAEKRTAKKEAFSLMQKKYERLKKTWQGTKVNEFDPWMKQELNNSHLLLIATYYDLVPMFQRMLKEEKNDLKKFYARVEQVGKLEKNQFNIMLSRFRQQ